MKLKISDRRGTWRRLLLATKSTNNTHSTSAATVSVGGALTSSGTLSSRAATPQHGQHSAASTDTELTTLDTQDLWMQESEPTPCTMSALHQFGAEMLKLSRGLEAASIMAGQGPGNIKETSHINSAAHTG